MPRRTTRIRILSSTLLVLAGLLATATVRAECGGSIDCIAVSVDPGNPPAHGTPLESDPLVFGAQAVGTTSAARSIIVGAVGGATGQATLDAITLSGPDAGEFSRAGTCTTGAPSLTHGGATCTIAVTFSPSSEGAKTASVTVVTSVITRTVPLSGGASDVADDPDAKSLVRAQIDTAKRFSRAQIGNIRRRLESMRAVRSSGVPTPTQALAAEAVGRDERAQTATETTVAKMLARLAAQRSLDLGQLSAVGSEGADTANQSWWVGGDIHFGTRDESSDGSSQEFSSEGLTIGYDWWLANRLAVGVGLGFADGETEIGSNDTEDSATSASLAGYLNYTLTPAVFLDAVLGFGDLSYDTERYDVGADDIAESSRDGTLWFTSLGAGYEWRYQELLLSPFARLEFTSIELDSERESGSANNLRYRSQTIDTSQLVLGLLAEAPHQTSFGWALPRLRLELYFEDEDEEDADVSFVNVVGAPTSSIAPSDAPDETLLFGLGTELFYRNGLQLGLEYQGLHSSGDYDSQIFALRLSGNLDGKPASWAVPARLRKEPVRVEAGYAAFENINRAPDSSNELTDDGFDVTARKAIAFAMSPNSQFVLSGDLSGTNMREHDGLDRVSAAGQGEFQYRTGAGFGAPQFGAFARASFDAYDSSLRSGSLYKLGVNAHKRITDRISVFGVVESRTREAESDVFDTEDAGLRLALDYSLTENDLLRLSGEYRDGDTVSSTRGSGSDFFSPIADADEEDDAYHDKDFIAYRFEAETQIWTLGYNRALGPQDSIDIAVQFIESEPDDAPPGDSSETYNSEQIALYYLTRF